MTKGEWAVLLGGISLIPAWRCGVREHLTFPEFILEHTVFGHEVTYIPAELLTKGETEGIYMEIR